MVELTYLSLKKTTFLCSYFWHISLCFYSKSKREISLDVEFNSASNDYPHCILLMDPATPQKINTWKNVMMMSSSHFPKIRNTWKNVLMMSSSHFLHVFIIFRVAGSIKSMQCAYSLDAELNSASNELSRSKFE